MTRSGIDWWGRPLGQRPVCCRCCLHNRLLNLHGNSRQLKCWSSLVIRSSSIQSIYCISFQLGVRPSRKEALENPQARLAYMVRNHYAQQYSNVSAHLHNTVSRAARAYCHYVLPLKQSKRVDAIFDAFAETVLRIVFHDCVAVCSSLVVRSLPQRRKGQRLTWDIWQSETS